MKKIQKNDKKYLPKWEFCGRILFVSGDGGMADALDSGSSGSYPVRVQVPFSAFDMDFGSFSNKGSDFFTSKTFALYTSSLLTSSFISLCLSNYVLRFFWQSISICYIIITASQYPKYTLRRGNLEFAVCSHYVNKNA